ncbi:amidase family protein [Pelagicoccus sp. SDUM812003]|uniref:amidase family protein n=1 Tax=Pelagicoccus sp. SDUM812003 TaxID=3041267 RepID=UPI00280E4F40|nr:amidase family protein [Pelagicoccus sp. SDUM812003]MDQ8204688.1 amidase family protein [Pelagicoccus sp. SDUM812003]
MFPNKLKTALVFSLVFAAAHALPAKEFNLQTATVADINEAFDAGALTAERLVELCTARIEAYDQKGPKLNAVIAINPKALEIARALDEERKTYGPRSPIHGIPVLLKDNYDTYDMPTTGASKALVGSMAPDDAFTVKQLRDAGAIIFAKVNLSELARSGVSISSLMGQTLNAFDQSRTPGGSSGGTGAAIAATFGILGTGSDTGQSTRSPSSANNLVGIRPTFGLISRDGIIPISYTQDTAGPITRYVADAAVMMDYLVGFDPMDKSTWEGVDKYPESYTDYLDADSLKDARIGFVPQLLGDGSHSEHAIVTEVTLKAIEDMKAAGATVFPVHIPILDEIANDRFDLSVSGFESKWTMDEYFASLGPDAKYKNLKEYVAAGLTYEPILNRLRQNAEMEDALQDPEYAKRLTNQSRFQDALVATMDEYGLDALLYTHQKRLVVPATKNPDQVERNGFMGSSSGLPAITFPGGFSPVTKDAPKGVPIGIEFLGRPFSEAQLIRLAYGYEQATKHRTTPPKTPSLPGESFSY